MSQFGQIIFVTTRVNPDRGLSEFLSDFQHCTRQLSQATASTWGGEDAKWCTECHPSIIEFEPLTKNVGCFFLYQKSVRLN